jgi:hypothetical protein
MYFVKSSSNDCALLLPTPLAPPVVAVKLPSATDTVMSPAPKLGVFTLITQVLASSWIKGPLMPPLVTTMSLAAKPVTAWSNWKVKLTDTPVPTELAVSSVMVSLGVLLAA